MTTFGASSAARDRQQVEWYVILISTGWTMPPNHFDLKDGAWLASRLEKFN